MKTGYVYILTNKSRSTLYIGVTSDLKRRIVEHEMFIGSKFTSKYNLNILVFFEEFSDMNQAIARETQLKNWHREWKFNLIKMTNPKLEELETL